MPLGADETRQNCGGACWCAAGFCTGVGTLLQHTKGKSAGRLTHVSSPADLSCPSWARAEGDLWGSAAGGLLGPTRTLLIQSRKRVEDLQALPRSPCRRQGFKPIDVLRGINIDGAGSKRDREDLLPVGLEDASRAFVAIKGKQL
jgi:hypothetical protein